ncbi:MAG: mechanosensitive ion channel family protein [Candidatus Diapherotrites archaeon]|nr:mechanosensitive ion channel family protein [Candidatus Diapherotrites archaeon]
MMHELEILLTTSVLGNLVAYYVIALCVFVATFLSIYVFRERVIRKLKAVANRTKTDVDDVLVSVVESLPWWSYMLLATAVSMMFIRLPGWLQQVPAITVMMIGAFYATKAIMAFISHYVDKSAGADMHAANLAKTGVKIVLWLIVIVFILSNLGYDLSSIIAGLGIGGVAVALAVQNILEDVFSAFSIYFDKPFRVGDFIAFDSYSGTVKKIGIKSTRIQTLQGQELIVSNKDLLGSRINNYRRMKSRRVEFNFGVTYDTPQNKLEKIHGIVADVFKNVERATLKSVHFTKFGDYSLGFTVVYFIDSNDYDVYMDVQQAVNLGIKERFGKASIEMAFPTQTVFLNKK